MPLERRRQRGDAGVARLAGRIADADESDNRFGEIGDGAIDLGRERIDFTVSPSVKDAGLVSLTVPIRISGSLEQPSITLDSGRLAQDTVGAVADLAESIGSFVGIGSSSDKARNPCAAALAAPVKRHSQNRPPRRVSRPRP